MSSLTTYYVSSGAGRDAYDGRTPQTPFRTLNRVNRLKLHPGDRVLLECGSVFEGQFLRITDSGSEENCIEIGAYGEGDIPRIDADGAGIWYQDYGVKLDAETHVNKGYVSSAVLIYDASYIYIHDIEITNSPEIPGEIYEAAHKMDRTGLAVVARDKGTLRGLRISALSIHHVYGNVYNKHMNNGGIYITALKPEDEVKTGAARYEDITIENCFVYKVSRWGIAAGYTYQHEKFKEAELSEELFYRYGHLNMVIRNNYVKEAGGDGITAMYALKPLIEHNTADSAAQEMNDRSYRYPEDRLGKVAAAIWPWKCKDALLRYNEAADTRLNQDGMAYDADSGDGTRYEYNFSRLNEGGCIMFCLEQAVHNSFCCNVSHDDLGGTISPSGNPDAYLAHNTFYVRENVPLVRNHMDGGKYVMEENTFIKLPPASRH